MFSGRILGEFWRNRRVSEGISLCGKKFTKKFLEKISPDFFFWDSSEKFEFLKKLSKIFRKNVWKFSRKKIEKTLEEPSKNFWRKLWIIFFFNFWSIFWMKFYKKSGWSLQKISFNLLEHPWDLLNILKKN